jgi:endonuclease III
VTRVAIKNAKACQSRLRKLLSQVPHGKVEMPDGKDSTRALMESILEADATRKEAVAACQALYDGFLDLNELRVATPREIADCWDRSFPGATEKADSLRRVLNAIFDRTYQMKLEYMESLPKRDLRKHLLGLGLSPYAAARVQLGFFSAAAVPVDSSLLETLQMEGEAPPEATVEEVQEILEKLVPSRGAPAAHAFLRSYVEKFSKALAVKRKKESVVAARKEREAAEVRAKAEAEAEALAQAARREKAAQEVKAAAEAKAKGRKSVAARIRRAARKKKT